MVRFVCNCFNVQVHCKETKPVRISPDNVEISGLDDCFFREEPLAASLDIGGIVTEIGNLVKSRCISDWQVSTCLNCGVDTHAIHKTQGMDRVLVSNSLETDPTRQAMILQHKDFSPVFKIVVKPESLQNQVNTNTSTKEDAFLEIKNVISKKVMQFLKKEHDLMKERIRVYNNQQCMEYKNLQSRIQLDQQMILNCIYNSLENHNVDDKSHTGKEQLNNNGKTQEKSVKIQDLPPLPPPPLIPAPTRPLQKIVQISPKPRPTQPRRVIPKRNRDDHLFHSLDVDAIFPIDDMDMSLEDNNLMEESDSDEFETDVFSDNYDLYSADRTGGRGEGDQSVEDSNGYKSGNFKSNTIYAASLPIAMPMWSNSNYSARKPSWSRHEASHTDYGSDSDRDLAEESNPEKIAASIKALAQSVHGNDGTEMFGDLPRPRLNTLG